MTKALQMCFDKVLPWELNLEQRKIDPNGTGDYAIQVVKRG